MALLKEVQPIHAFAKFEKIYMLKATCDESTKQFNSQTILIY